MSKGRPKHLIIPIFIPNQGCPHRCVFCEQERITSQVGVSVDGKHVKGVLDRAIHTTDFNRQTDPEVAFFGGTFTRLPKYRIRELLEAVKPYIQEGLFRSIRVSTRPDALDDQRLELMKSYGVLTVELGAQSMDNEVLALCKRGHTAEDTINAVSLLRAWDFRVGIQLMPGLPGDSEKGIHATISEVIKLHPDMVRLYPTLVIQGTELARWYKEGRYRPMSLDKAVDICMESCIRLESNGIPVIRIGLMSSPSLLEKGQIVAGPWHPAFGFLVRSGIHQKGIEQDLPRPGEASGIKIHAPKREIPLLRGYKNLGLEWIERKTGARINAIETDDSIPPGRVIIEKL